MGGCCRSVFFPLSGGGLGWVSRRRGVYHGVFFFADRGGFIWCILSGRRGMFGGNFVGRRRALSGWFATVGAYIIIIFRPSGDVLGGFFDHREYFVTVGAHKTLFPGCRGMFWASCCGCREMFWGVF